MIQKSPFPIALVFPPQGHYTQPYLALPCLKAWLERHGQTDVRLYDANIEAYDHWLSRAGLARARELLRERAPLARFDGREPLPFARMDAFRAAAEGELIADELIERIDAAKQVLRGPEFWDIERYQRATRTLYQALRLVSAAHYPSQLTPHNFTMRYSVERSADVLAALEAESENPYLEYFRARLLPRIVAQRPRLLGLSVIYGSQLIPALTLGRLVKQALPDCHVTAGGGFLAYIGKKLLAAQAPGGGSAFAHALDSLIFYEGEEPMRQLAEQLASRASLAAVGSLGWFDRARAGAPAVINELGHPIQLDRAPAPSFDGLPFELYFAPEVVLPYDVNRGCYYGECTFCTLPTVIGPGYRTRSAATIAEQIVALTRKHGTRRVNFVTDCMPPGMLRDLPEELLRREAGITWWSDARIEPKAYTPEGCARLYESGCRKLLFGFETATPRLLKMMQKGQSLRATLEVAENCARAGISVTFYAMVGFPSETREEARATLRVLLENAHVVREVSLQTFHVDEIAQTYREPERFGLKILDEPGADLALYHEYEAEQGMTQQEAAEMFGEMMAGLREHFPLFAGDEIHFFMQKSHYFLHLSRGTSPDEFARESRARAARRAGPFELEALAPAPGLRAIELPHSYAEAVRRLGSPQARALRPDFLCGRVVPGALRIAERELGALPAERKLLAWEPLRGEFLELSPDGRVFLERLRAAGTLGALLEQAPAAARARLTAFAERLVRAGLLVVAPRALAGARA